METIRQKHILPKYLFLFVWEFLISGYFLYINQCQYCTWIEIGTYGPGIWGPGLKKKVPKKKVPSRKKRSRKKTSTGGHLVKNVPKKKIKLVNFYSVPILKFAFKL